MNISFNTIAYLSLEDAEYFPPGFYHTVLLASKEECQRLVLAGWNFNKSFGFFHNLGTCSQGVFFAKAVIMIKTSFFRWNLEYLIGSNILMDYIFGLYNHKDHVILVFKKNKQILNDKSSWSSNNEYVTPTFSNHSTFHHFSVSVLWV